KKAEVNSEKVSGVLINYLKSVHKWDGSLEYEFGSNELSGKKDRAPNTFDPPAVYYSTPVLNERVRLVTREGELWGTAQEEALRQGNLVHNIFSETDTIKDLPASLKKYRKKENLTTEVERELTTLITGVIHHPDLESYFAPDARVLREKDIVNPSGEILRPDRLNFNGNKVAIIDYKTGRFMTGHREQMNGYAFILSQMGFEVEKKILIYINNDVNISIV